MPIAAFVLTLLSSLLLAAHFLRLFDVPGMLCSLALPLFFIVRRPWARWLLQASAIASATIWILTALAIKAQRRASGQPWGRMFLILAAVGLFSLLPLFVLASSRARSWFAGIRGEGDSSLQ